MRRFMLNLGFAVLCVLAGQACAEVTEPEVLRGVGDRSDPPEPPPESLVDTVTLMLSLHQPNPLTPTTLGAVLFTISGPDTAQVLPLGSAQEIRSVVLSDSARRVALLAPVLPVGDIARVVISDRRQLDQYTVTVEQAAGPGNAAQNTFFYRLSLGD